MADRRKPFLKNHRAFTLVELMVALAVSGVLMMATLTIADMSIQTYSIQERVADAQQNVRAALDLMVRDIRMAGYDPMAITNGPTEGIGILVATDTMLQFSADLNADQKDSGGIENLTYSYDSVNKRLRQQEGGKAYPQTFIENVSALTFRYFDASGARTTHPADIVMVEVALTVENRGHKGRLFRRKLTTWINCRNLRL